MKSTIILVIALTIGLAAAAQATPPGPFVLVGTDALAYSPFSLERSARNQAMSAAGVADPATAANAVYNPANLIGAPALSSHYNQHDYTVTTYRDIGVAGSRAFHDGRFELALALRHVWQDRAAVFTGAPIQSYETGGRVTAGTVAAAIKSGRARYTAGVSLEYGTVDDYFGSLDALAVDVGMRADWRFTTAAGNAFVYRLGASALNLGSVDSDVYYADLPSHVRVGTGVTFGTGLRAAPFRQDAVPALAVAIDMDYLLNTDDSPDDGFVGGVELGLVDTFFLRVGAGSGVRVQDDGVTYGAGLAFGYAAFRARLDMAVYDNGAGYGFQDQETIFGLTLDYLR